MNKYSLIKLIVSPIIMNVILSVVVTFAVPLYPSASASRSGVDARLDIQVRDMHSMFGGSPPLTPLTVEGGYADAVGRRNRLKAADPMMVHGYSQHQAADDVDNDLAIMGPKDKKKDDRRNKHGDENFVSATMLLDPAEPRRRGRQTTFAPEKSQVSMTATSNADQHPQNAKDGTINVEENPSPVKPISGGVIGPNNEPRKTTPRPRNPTTKGGRPASKPSSSTTRSPPTRTTTTTTTVGDKGTGLDQGPVIKFDNGTVCCNSTSEDPQDGAMLEGTHLNKEDRPAMGVVPLFVIGPPKRCPEGYFLDPNGECAKSFSIVG